MNTSGIQPVELKVLVKPKEIEEKVGSIILPDQNQEREKYAQIHGEIVATSPLAFGYAKPDEWRGMKPKVGDSVIYAKYAGVNVRGADGVEYTIINDEDVCAVTERSK